MEGLLDEVEDPPDGEAEGAAGQGPAVLNDLDGVLDDQEQGDGQEVPRQLGGEGTLTDQVEDMVGALPDPHEDLVEDPFQHP